MTSTSFNVGLNDGARLSSRVLRPPGGGHTDIFSGEPEPAPRGRRGAPPVQNTAAAHQQESKPTNGTTHNGQEQQKSEAKSAEPTLAPASSPVEQPTKAEAPKAEAPKAEAPRAEPPQAEAPRAEPPKAEAPRAEPIKAEPPKRVRVPPGGFSSGLW